MDLVATKRKKQLLLVGLILLKKDTIKNLDDLEEFTIGKGSEEEESYNIGLKTLGEVELLYRQISRILPKE